jgi:hypothetical protein
MLDSRDVALMAIAQILGFEPPRYRGREQYKCLLPCCNILTDHNGGYCCAEHCKEHKRLQSERR